MTNDYGSHLPLLYEAMHVTRGTIVELGSGLCSTPVIHGMGVFASEEMRQAYTLDDDPTWLAVMRARFVHDKHEFVHITRWAQQIEPFVDMKPSVVLIDHGPAKDIKLALQLRVEAVRAFQDAEVLIVHDINNIMCQSEEYLEMLLKTFAFIYHDEHTHPTTHWLSKTIGPRMAMQRVFAS